VYNRQQLDIVFSLAINKIDKKIDDLDRILHPPSIVQFTGAVEGVMDGIQLIELSWSTDNFDRECDELVLETEDNHE